MKSFHSFIQHLDESKAKSGKDYDEFFQKKLEEWEVESIGQLSKKGKKYFFEEIEKEWK